MFDGKTFDYRQDYQRLRKSLDRVAHLMGDGRWRTLRQIADQTGSSEAGVSARLRDLRKTENREYYRVAAVDSERHSGGLWVYRVRQSYQPPAQIRLFG